MTHRSRRIWPALQQITAAALWLACSAGVLATEPVAPAQAELPLQRVDTSYHEPQGDVIRVAAGGDLQKALDSASYGDVIELEAGAVYQGSFRLPRKEGSGWIVIRSSEAAKLEPGRRVSPEDAAYMARLVSGSDPVVSAAPGAHHYRFIGIEIAPQEDVFLHNLVLLEGASRDELPQHIIFDRCYIHGDAKLGARRGIALNSGAAAVINSHLSDFKMRGADSQAIAGWGGSGPYAIVNNYLEGAGENLMFGGADPRIRDLVPSDIEIRGNHFAKPLSWKDSPSHWTIKNLLELKNARRVLIDGNLFEHHWPQSQSGFSILFTVRNQEGSAPWSVVEDVTFSNNIVRNVSDGINILAVDDIHSSGQAARITIRNNLFENIGGEWGSGRLFQLLGGLQDLIIENNTASNSGSILMVEGPVNQRVAFRSNTAIHNEYGFIGTGTGVGNATLKTYFSDLSFHDNFLIGGPPGNYPANNEFPFSMEGPASRGDGKSAGVNIRELCTAVSVSDRPSSCR